MSKYYYYYYYYYYVVCRHRPFLPGSSPPEPKTIPTAQVFKFQTAVLSVLCVMFLVWLSFVVNLLNVCLVWLPDFSLSLLLLV